MSSGRERPASLESVGEDLWLVDGPVVDFYGFAYPTRSVIARLADGALWLWSPIALTDALTRAVDSLGPVRHLVSPNKLHHLYLQDWRAAYPDAELWGPRSTIEKRRDLDFAGALENTPPAAWANEIDQAWFRGSFLLDEIVFFHRASRTAILADLSENLSDAFLRERWPAWQRAIARVWGIGDGYAPLEFRLSFLERAPARAAKAKALAWDPTRVVMAHGEWQRENGRAYLERVFSWL